MGEGGEAAVTFSWYDPYSGDPVVCKDVRFEQACVLYNLGGLYSQLGEGESRATEDSMRNACTYFQCAAGVYQFLKENFNLEEQLVDMNKEMFALKSTIMLVSILIIILETLLVVMFLNQMFD